MEEWESDLNEQLFTDEKVIAQVPNLEIDFAFPPYPTPASDWSAFLLGRLILSNKRLITRFWNNKAIKYFSTSVIHNLTERKIQSCQPKWPYQANLMVAGGLILTVQTKQIDKSEQEKLSSLLHQAFMWFGNTHYEDLGVIDALIAAEIKRNQD